jgi:hypothetical protein
VRNPGAGCIVHDSLSGLVADASGTGQPAGLAVDVDPVDGSLGSTLRSAGNLAGRAYPRTALPIRDIGLPSVWRSVSSGNDWDRSARSGLVYDVLFHGRPFGFGATR